MPDQVDDDGWDTPPNTANRELVASLPLKLQCTVCGLVVALGDDPTRRALWEADFIENDGWTHGPAGLICDRCSPPRKPHESAPPRDLRPEERENMPDILW